MNSQESKSSAQYLAGDLSQLVAYSRNSENASKPASYIDDQVLVAHLQHAHRDQTTDILNWKDCAYTFTLRVCGRVRFVLPGQREVSSSDGLTPEYLQALLVAAQLEDFEFLETPYFEWITEDGDAAGDVFDQISVRADDEINSLHEMLETDE